jgi:hypothetical protein
MVFPTKKLPSWLLKELFEALGLDAIALWKVFKAVAVRNRRCGRENEEVAKK